jgi:hypothetical protein
MNAFVTKLKSSNGFFLPFSKSLVYNKSRNNSIFLAIKEEGDAE